MTKSIPLFVLFVFAGLLQAQELVSIEFIEEQSAQALENEYGVPSEYDIELYRVLYTTTDLYAAQDTASGLLIVPKDRALQYPMLCYQHGTGPDRYTGMSNLALGDVTLTRIYGSFGFIVVAPDYLGVLSSRGFHPYVHADSEASAAIDMMKAVRDYGLTQIESTYNNRLFITGYSQGGHGAMAVHRELQLNQPDEFNIIASLPMSGPYSISEKMVDSTLGDTEYFFVAYLPNVALSYKAAYPALLQDLELEDIFKPEYVIEINKFVSEEYDLFELNTALINKLIELEGASIPALMMQDSTLNNIKTDPSHPLSMALADNDVYDWTPTAFNRMYYCVGDDQVSYQNSILAEEVMNSNGATLTEATRLDTPSNPEDHGGCVFPAVNAAIQFTYILKGITSNVTNVLDQDQIGIAPNPASEYMAINLDSDLSLDNTRIQIIDINGKIVKQEKINTYRQEISIVDLETGIYVVEIYSPSYRGVTRLMKL